MQIDRRKLLGSLGAFTLMAPAARPLEAGGMYGLISKLTVVHGKRDEMIAVLKESAAGMPGCFSYIVAKDATDEDVVWVMETWDTAASHDASLSLPSVKNALPQAKALLAKFERVSSLGNWVAVSEP